MFFFIQSGTKSGGHRVLQTVLASRYTCRFSSKTQYTVFLLLLIIALQVAVSDVKLAEVTHFLLIVREISMVLVINWARKLVDWRC